jgi:hypothetical protein
VSETEDRRENKLPVTAEIGGEGGSYADPTIQVPTFHEDLPRTDETVTDAPMMIPADPEPKPRMRRDVSE